MSAGKIKKIDKYPDVLFRPESSPEQSVTLKERTCSLKLGKTK